MITKEEFIKFIKTYQEFDKAVDRFDKAITGKSYSTILFETDWFNAVGEMLDIFLDVNFNEDGKDIVYWWMFEDVNHVITETVNSDLFNVESEVEYNVNDLEDLYDYLIKFKKNYLKDV